MTTMQTLQNVRTKALAKMRKVGETDRDRRLAPNGVPKWIRCFDNGGKTIDRYTVFFTNIAKVDRAYLGKCLYLAMNAAPLHPQGFGQHGECDTSAGRSGGKRIKFEELPHDCQVLVLNDYCSYWGLDRTKYKPIVAVDAGPLTQG